MRCRCCCLVLLQSVFKCNACSGFGHSIHATISRPIYLVGAEWRTRNGSKCRGSVHSLRAFNDSTVNANNNNNNHISRMVLIQLRQLRQHGHSSHAGIFVAKLNTSFSVECCIARIFQIDGCELNSVSDFSLVRKHTELQHIFFLLFSLFVFLFLLSKYCNT